MPWGWPGRSAAGGPWTSICGTWGAFPAGWAGGLSRLALLLETLAATGVRVSEVRYITVEAARAGSAQIALKGKLRRVLLPAKLCRKLLKYAGKQKTASGEIFLTRSGASLGRKQIWAELKALARRTGVKPRAPWGRAGGNPG